MVGAGSASRSEGGKSGRQLLTRQKERILPVQEGVYATLYALRDFWVLPRDSCWPTSDHLVSRPPRTRCGGDGTDDTVRFWGWRENGAELARSKSENAAAVAAGKPIYGETDMTDYQQAVAARNSTWSQLKFHAIPW